MKFTTSRETQELAKVASDSLDLIEDPSLFCRGATDLFGKKFKKFLSNGT